MNPLTLVKRIQKINSKEAALGISDEASWHAKYKDSAYVFVGGVPFELTEGDLLAVFAQYGEIVDINLVKDKATGKSKGFSFVAYEDQRSTNLAVDNLNGAQVLGRTIRVDHVSNYKKKEEEDEETEQMKREARGICFAFQKGECNRGAACKFSHHEKRAANTGWGPQDDNDKRWSHNKFDGPIKGDNRLDSGRNPRMITSAAKDKREDGGTESRCSQSESNLRDQDIRGLEKRSRRLEKEKEPNHKDDDLDKRGGERKSAGRERESDYDYPERVERRSEKRESDFYAEEGRDRRRYSRSDHDRDHSSRHHRQGDEFRRH